jgi:hypothetical protein
MHQHLHAPLAIDQLEGVPQPVVVLLDVLLEKDPTRRFQNPAELLKAMPVITGAIDARRRITRQSLQYMATPASRAVARNPRARLGPEKISVARLPITGSDVFGREEDIAFLDVGKSECLSSDSGAKLLRALGVNGDEAELRSASKEFSGHCFALALLGSYLTDAYNEDIRCRSEVLGHLAHDVRQGSHARPVMES